MRPHEWDEEIQRSRHAIKFWAKTLRLPYEHLVREYDVELLSVRLLHGSNSESERRMFHALVERWKQTV